MKKNFHPKYYKCNVICNCGENRGVLFTTRSTVPEIKVEICSLCHPFFTGTQKIVDTAGRVEKFVKKYGATRTSKMKTAPVGTCGAPTGKRTNS